MKGKPMSDIPALLQPLKDRLEVITPLPWIDWDRGIGHEIRDQHGEPINSGHRETFSARDAAFIAAAPTDQAKLIAAVEAIDSLVDKFEQSSEGFGLDLQDDDFERGWHGARKETVAMIRAALTQALGGDGA